MEPTHQQPPPPTPPQPQLQAAIGMPEPPAYSPPEPTRPIRSIADLRAQIIANGSVIRPRTDVNKSSDDHIELIVAKTPAPVVANRNRGGTHWSEKDALKAFNRGTDSMGRPAALGRGAVVGGSSGSGGGVGRSGDVGGQKHYAVLVKRSGSGRTIYGIIQGEPRDTVEEALEWMLERTECMMHDLMIRHGKPDPGDGCVVM